MACSFLAADMSHAHWRTRSAILGTLWLILAVLLALAWLAFSYVLNGRRILGDVGYSIQAERMDRSGATAQLLSRRAFGPDESEILFISDLRIDADGSISPNTDTDWVNGRQGDHILVNGQKRPTLTLNDARVSREWLSDRKGQVSVTCPTSLADSDLRVPNCWPIAERSGN